ncbi:DEKNAAC103181 [Brettanomyces naardenensis]|uniref:DEKNAAC103181 n=1 Tax=Brettanomyces naardenensis TaxID=13370 RepID=A0A448YMT9_BRENA|nr:DEKNAAC103181 [Brettanomyces naardenensis]
MAFEGKVAKLADDIKNILDCFPKIWNVYFICSITTAAGFMFGFDITSISTFIGTNQYRRYFNNPGSTAQGIITFFMALGSFFGSLISSFVSEPFGRRTSLFLSSFFWMVGAAIQSSSQNRVQLTIGRFIAGIGVGFGSTVAPVYGSELAPRKIRGLIGGMFQFFVYLGQLVMFCICYGLHFINGVASFRIAWALQILFGLFLFIGIFFVPESPRWLAKNDYWDESEEVVAKIQAHGDTTNEDVIVEMSEIKEQVLVDEASEVVTYAALFNKKYRARTITALFAQIWQQLTGINVMMYYIVYIFEMAGYTGNTNLVASLIQYILATVLTFISLFTLDIFGRRFLLLLGAALMFVFEFGLAGILAAHSNPVSSVDGNTTIRIEIPSSDKGAARGAIAMCYLYVCSFAISWGVCIWVYCSEVWGSNAIRQRGAALSTSADWIFNFAIGMYTPSSFENITWKNYCIYGVFCACMFVHVYFFFPETRGRRLEEVAQIWDDHIPVWKTASWEPSVPVVNEDDASEKKDEASFVENVSATGADVADEEQADAV